MLNAVVALDPTEAQTVLAPGNVGDDANHTLGLTYTEFIPIIVKSIQDIAHIAGAFKDDLVAWLGNAAYGIGDLFANNLHAQNELCVGSTCVTPAQFQTMVAVAGQTTGASGQGSAGRDSGAPATTTPGTLPVIEINADNPATIQVGTRRETKR